MDGQEKLWKVRVLVTPVIEWEKLSLDNFVFSTKENVTPGHQVENELELFVNVLSQNSEGAGEKAK